MVQHYVQYLNIRFFHADLTTISSILDRLATIFPDDLGTRVKRIAGHAHMMCSDGSFQRTHDLGSTGSFRPITYNAGRYSQRVDNDGTNPLTRSAAHICDSRASSI